MINNDPSYTQKLAESLTNSWNKLSKIYGWPQQKNADHVLRTPNLLTPIKKYLNQLHQNLTKEQIPAPDDLFHEILTQWNWQKSPAPLQLLASEQKWKSLKYRLEKQNEEKQELQEAHIQRIIDLTKKEWNKQRKTSQNSTEASQKTEEYLRATGTWEKLSPTEKLALCHELEILSLTQ